MNRPAHRVMGRKHCEEDTPAYTLADLPQLQAAARRNREWLNAHPEEDAMLRESMEWAAEWYERKVAELLGVSTETVRIPPAPADESPSGGQP